MGLLFRRVRKLRMCWKAPAIFHLILLDFSFCMLPETQIFLVDTCCSHCHSSANTLAVAGIRILIFLGLLCLLP
ncbi:hypothetical protein BX667DRAFT_502896 [Coemansia mojavensis]|nr:hypothetical protein BX667DRAFT_502896 [Coemansia mojavensis]